MAQVHHRLRSCRLAFVTDQDTDGVDEPFISPATGGGATKVMDTLVGSGEVLDFAWSPSGWSDGRS